MLKYTEVQVCFSEIPEEITLCINISGCPIHCKECHSPYLWENIGEDLSFEAVLELIKNNSGITCIAFMGGDAEPEYVDELAQYIRTKYPQLKVAWYSGRTTISPKINLNNFDYIKVGPYISYLGPLNSKTTNQKLYRLKSGELEDITSYFWKK